MDQRPEPPFSGRIEELRSLERKLDEAIAGHGSTVLISGPAGIGKTRLCEMLESKALAEGCTVLVGRCLPGAPMPYLPFIDAFRPLGRGGVGREGPNRHKADARGSGGGSSMDMQARSERNLLRLLDTIHEVSSKGTLVLRLEDLHWGDSASIQALHFISRNIADLRVLVLATYRQEDLGRDQGGRPHPLSEYLRDMRREGAVNELAIPPLDARDLIEMLQGLLGSCVDDELGTLMMADSGGNPLFAIELVRYLVDSGHIGLERGRWHLVASGLMSVPKTIQEIVLRRTERLPQDEKRVLESASVLGGRVDPRIVAAIIDTPILSVLDRLDDLEREHGLLTQTGEDYRFSHEMVQRVTYESISEMRRKELHLRAGQAIEGLGDTGGRLSELAGHFCKSGSRDRCLIYSFQAGEKCWKHCAFPEAIPLLSKVMDLTEGDMELSETRFRTLEYLGDSEYQQGRFADALSRFQECFARATGFRRPRMLRKMAECWLMGHMGSDMVLANCLIEEAASCPNIDPVELGEIFHFKARAARYVGSLDEADRLYTLAEGQFQDPALASRLAFEIGEHAYLKSYQERYEEALSMYERVMKLLEQNPFPTAEIENGWSLGGIHFVKGQYDDAINQLVRSADLASRIGDHQNLRWCYYYLGFIYEQLGDRRTAIRYLNSSIEENLKERGQYHYLAPVLLAHLLLHDEELDEAAEIVDHAQDVIDERYRCINTPMKGLAKVVMGEILARKGLTDMSDLRFREGFALFKGTLEGSNYDAIAHVWYGDVLEAQDRRQEAIASYRKALELYETNGNLSQWERTAKRIGDLERATSAPGG